MADIVTPTIIVVWYVVWASSTSCHYFHTLKTTMTHPGNVKNLFPCFKCKKLFMTHRYIYDHIKSCEVLPKSIEPTNDIFKCCKCSTEFDNEDELACHRHSVCLDASSYVCPMCGKDFGTLRQFQNHKQTHKERSSICDVCGFKARTEDALKRHKLTHSDQRSHKCLVCPAAFKNVYSLGQHNRIHEDRKYECHYCQKKFRNVENLKLHFASHKELKFLRKYQCPMCDKTFAIKRDRERHMKSHVS
jgi:KRAB domain-containing zinc finger protein